MRYYRYIKTFFIDLYLIMLNHNLNDLIDEKARLDKLAQYLRYTIDKSVEKTSHAKLTISYAVEADRLDKEIKKLKNKIHKIENKNRY